MLPLPSQSSEFFFACKCASLACAHSDTCISRMEDGSHHVSHACYSSRTSTGAFDFLYSYYSFHISTLAMPWWENILPTWKRWLQSHAVLSMMVKLKGKRPSFMEKMCAMGSPSPMKSEMHSANLVFLCFLCMTYANRQNEWLNHFDGCALRSNA